MYNKIWSIIGIIAIFIIIIGVISYDKKGQNMTIKIGVAVPLTGNNGFAGESVRNAILLAQSKLVNSKYQYEVIFEDTQTDPKSAITVAQKLIEIDKVDVIIDAYAPIGVTISPLAEKAEVLHIGIAFDPRIAEGEYNFINFVTPDTAVKKFLIEMNKRGLSTLGIFHLNNPGILAVNESLIRLSPEYGIKIVTNQEFQPGDRDFRSIIAKAQITKPQIYALLSIAPEIEILTKQLKELNLNNLTTVIYFETSSNKSLYEGLWSVGFGQALAEFEEEYKNIYKGDLSWAAPNAYDSFNLIVKAAEVYTGQGKPPIKFIANQIQNLKNFTGVLGRLTVDDRGIIDSSVLVKVVKNGILVPIE